MHRILLAVLLLAAAAFPAAAAELSGTDIIIPIVGRGPGSHGTFWKTDVLVTNLSTAWTNVPVTFDFMSGGEVQTYTFTLGTHEGFVMQDFVRYRLKREAAFGVLRVRTVNPAGIIAKARVYDGEGIGQSVQGISTASLMRDANLTGLMTGKYRTNIGIANPHDVAAEVTLVAGSGTASWWVDVHVPAHDVTQVNLATLSHLLDDQGITVIVHSRVPVYPYASIVRNGTSESQFVMPAELRLPDEVAPQCLDAHPIWNLTSSTIDVWYDPASTTPAQLAAKYGLTIEKIHGEVPAIRVTVTPRELATLRCAPEVKQVGHYSPYTGPIV
jgi:hypothetical protein